MKFINENHYNLIKEMLDGFGVQFDKSIEAVSTKDIIVALMLKVNRDGVMKLLDYLDKHGFYDAPASTRFHGNYKGGLADHSLNVCAMLYNENKVHNGGLSNETIIISSLMHDLCKVDFYVTEIKNVKKYVTEENKNEFKGLHIKHETIGDTTYDFCWVPTEAYSVQEQMPLPHGSKSLYILQGFIKVTREEAFLITWHMGPYANISGDNYGFNNAVDYQPSVVLMYTADLLASSLYETTV